MAATISLAIRAQNRDSGGTAINIIDIVVDVLGVLPRRVALHDAEERVGRRLYKRKGYRRTFTVDVRETTVMASGWDYGDVSALEEALTNRDEVYLRATGTHLKRTNTTGGVDHNFWTGTNGILNAGDVQVECTAGPEVSPSFQTGGDKVTFTLEVVEPNT